MPDYRTGGGFGGEIPPRPPGSFGPLDFIREPDLGQYLPFLLPGLRFQPRPASQPRSPFVPQVPQEPTPQGGILSEEALDDPYLRRLVELQRKLQNSLDQIARQEGDYPLGINPEADLGPAARNLLGQTYHRVVVRPEGGWGDIIFEAPTRQEALQQANLRYGREGFDALMRQGRVESGTWTLEGGFVPYELPPQLSPNRLPGPWGSGIE